MFQPRWQMGFGACLSAGSRGKGWPREPWGDRQRESPWVLGAARQARPEAQCAVWPLGSQAQAALRGNFQPSVSPPEGLARDRLRVFRALEIPTWPVCPQHGAVCPQQGHCRPSTLGVVPPGLATVTARSLGISSNLSLHSLQLRCDKFYLLIGPVF